jgi:TolB-like protein/predicted Zn-dependent protease
LICGILIAAHVEPGLADRMEHGALIRQQLDRILSSPGFVNSPRMRQFLQVVVENSLSGASPLKETTIGVQVFGRAADYDSGAEPIVRVEARRLREKLQQYYERWGAAAPVVIHLPKGGYTPEFQIAPAAVAPEVPEVSAATAISPPPSPVQPASARWRFISISAAALGCIVLSIFIANRPLSWRPGASPVVQPIASIAVLPLLNLSGDPGQDYVADGMTDELIGSLAQISSLRVISRTSAMQYKGSRKALPQIARELGVDAVVEGSLTRSGQEVRITAQLIEAKTDRHLWSEDYRRQAHDMMTIESEVARAITSEIRLKLSTSEESLLRRQTGVAPDVWDAYLKGRYFWNRRTESDLRKSIVYYQEAVTRMPGYAAAWAGLADSWLLLGETWVRPNGRAFAEAEHAANRALALDNQLGEAHASLAALQSNRGQWESAEAEFRRALELKPGYATGRQWYAEGLAAHGRIDEALAEIRRARELDPLSLTVNVQVGYILFLARRYDEAIVQLRATTDMDPYFWMAHAVLGHAYQQKFMYKEATQELQKAADLTSPLPGQRMWLALAWALAGRSAEARHTRADIEEAFARGDIEAPPVALLDLALGERDHALARLQTACATHNLSPLLPSPVFDPLRADSEIAAMLAACTVSTPLTRGPDEK